jgi:tetratricopeptide (TPR) repeat protein
MKKYVSFILLFLNIFIYSQQPLNYPYIEKTTYKHYLNSDWESLIKLGNKSLDKGIDFYYLQIRMGVAYFAKNNYRKAIKHLQKAYKTNPKDDFLLTRCAFR